MATYAELYDKRSDSALRNRVAIACVVAADTIRAEADTTPNHAARLLWAKGAMEAPDREAERMLTAVLAQNRSFTIAQITAAADSALQSAVDAAVNAFAL